ncbi:MAG: glycine/betaine ABC transporter substrate-binding protein [Elusimicrobia bacterium]|nr:MAG: glycine/betaine ABC transporter substrate-binding protein [Elusimicrobiota bacterium]
MNSFFSYFTANRAEILKLTLEHCGMVSVAMSLGVLVGVPLGILLTRKKHLAPIILGATTTLQTIPSVALLALLMLLPLIGGIGFKPAITALFLYSLLAIVENTYAGIEQVHQPTVEAGRGMGMTDTQILTFIEIPQALPIIVAGVRISAVVCVATATIASYIGAGGLGDLIFRGVGRANNAMVAWGALPAIALSLMVHTGLTQFERRLQSKTAPNFKRIAVFFGIGTVLAFAVFGFLSPKLNAGKTIVIGSKPFTESEILGEMVAQLAESTGARVERKFYMGGNVCFESVKSGDMDAYIEYTGTGLVAHLKQPALTGSARVYEKVKHAYKERWDLNLLTPLGFNNTYAIAMRSTDAVKTISQLKGRGLRCGFDLEFADRPDGYPGLVKTYGEFCGEVKQMNSGLLYQALANGELDAISAYATDGRIRTLDLAVLDDDREFFPPYDAAVLAGPNLFLKAPGLEARLNALAGKISDADMTRMNAEVDSKKRAPKDVVREFLATLDK